MENIWKGIIHSFTYDGPTWTDDILRNVLLKAVDPDCINYSIQLKTYIGHWVNHDPFQI